MTGGVSKLVMTGEVMSKLVMTMYLITLSPPTLTGERRQSIASANDEMDKDMSSCS